MITAYRILSWFTYVASVFYCVLLFVSPNPLNARELDSDAWHYVSVQDQFGNYLLTNYQSDGSTARLRDSHSREIVPRYYDARMISLTQRWTLRSIRREETTLIKN
jgi:hypothetical protein